MDKNDYKKMFMQGDDKKNEQEKKSPLSPPERKRDGYDDYTRRPTPLTESEPPDTIEPETGWDRE